MNKRKENLIKNLKVAIHALKENTVHYDWFKQESCNCGVVAQAMLGKSPMQLSEMVQPFNNKTVLANALGMKKEVTDTTWKNGVKAYCPMTGSPIIQVFKDLFDAGLTRDDISHLEYMGNPLIRKRASINTAPRKIIKEGFFNKLFNVEEEKTDYYTSKNNLIKYLSAWVEILQEENVDNPDLDIAENNGIDTLRSMEINAVAEEKFEEAASLRDRIIKLVNLQA